LELAHAMAVNFYFQTLHTSESILRDKTKFAKSSSLEITTNKGPRNLLAGSPITVNFQSRAD